MQLPSIACLAAVLLVSAATARAEIGAYELLEEVRQAYSNLASYHDRGEIEILDAGPGTKRTLRFETYRDGDVFRVLVEDLEGWRRVLTREGGEIRLHDLELGQLRRPQSLGTALVEILGPEGFDALVVATAVAGSPAAFSPPEGAALEGVEPCGESSCYLLATSRLQGSHEALLWVERESFLVRRLEIVVHAGGEDLRQAMAEAGLDRAAPALTSAAGPRRFRVRHDVEPAGEAPASPSLADFVPPAGAREVADWERPAATEPAFAGAGLVFDDEISVELFTVTTRVVDGEGHPIPDLGPEDFRARIGRDEVPVVSVDWVSSDPAYRDRELEAELGRRGVELEPVEKLVVVFVQSGLHATRIRGHLRTIPHFRDFLASLQPNDRVAVVAFDSHLKLWLDFTRRHDEAEAAVDEAILFGSEPRLRRRGQTDPSLARHFDFRAARGAASPEQALEVVGRALEPIPGDKVMVYLGWGMGRFGVGGVTMTGDYAPAVAALLRARTSVFVLDVTDAGYHSLETGLRNVAAQTGGTYEKTSLFAAQATERLAATLTGRYVLTFSTGTLPRQTGILRIELRGKKGRVVADQFRVDRP